MEKNTNAFTEKVENLLDELFADDDSDQIAVEESSNVGYYPLRFLKATVLSIDWEITDETMARFIEQVDRLKSSHQEDRLILPLLQMLGSTGHHIRVFKQNSHPTVLKMLKSLYVSLEKVLTSQQMSENEKRQVLSKEIRKFKALKDQIVTGQLALANKSRKVTKSSSDSDYSPETTSSTPTSMQAKSLNEQNQMVSSMVETAVEELKQFIHDELQQLRKEFKSRAY
jgi:anti-sigma28 factor (negative regulator of flagellin synthesis)